MIRTALPLLGSLLVASCLVPSMNIVDSLGDAGDGGDGESGSGSGGTSMNGGNGGRGGSNQGGRTGGQNGSGGSITPEGGSGADDTGGTSGSGRDAGGRTGTSGTSNGGTSNGGTSGDGMGQGGTGNDGSGGTAGDDDSGGNGGTGANGGTAGMGGTFSNAGAAGSFAGRGGSFGNAGAAGSGSITCTNFSIGTDGFVRMPATGGACWHGYASAGGDVNSQVMPTTFSACGAGCMLRATGLLAAANEMNMYAGNIFLGFNVGQAPGSQTATTVTPTGSGIVFYLTVNAGTVRAQISSGNSASTRWCANVTSGSMIPYSSFNTQCWDPGGTGTAYSKQPIDSVRLVMPGAETAQAFDLAITNVREM